MPKQNPPKKKNLLPKKRRLWLRERPILARHVCPFLRGAGGRGWRHRAVFLVVVRGQGCLFSLAFGRALRLWFCFFADSPSLRFLKEEKMQKRGNDKEI